MTPAQRDWLALGLVEGVGGRTVRALLERFGSVGALLDASPGSLRGVPGVGRELAERIARAREVPAVQIEQRLIAEHGIDLITPEGPEFPALLREIYAPPPLLYRRGPASLNDGLFLAVVGTRNCTRTGEKATRRLVADLAALAPHLVIVSGLARGIDTAAHEAALEAGLTTVAVMAGGLADVYPRENRALAARIAGNGALITEFYMTQRPLARNFPIRNRIISGISAGVLVVEAGDKSGAIITAGFALNHNREVFAVPGNIDLPSFRGTNRLIQKGQAKLVRDAADILEELPGFRRPQPVQLDWLDPARSETGAPPKQYDEDKRLVLETLQKGPLHADDLADETGIPIEKLLGSLLELELSGDICQTEDNLYGLP